MKGKRENLCTVLDGCLSKGRFQSTKMFDSFLTFIQVINKKLVYLDREGKEKMGTSTYKLDGHLFPRQSNHPAHPT